MQFKNCNSNSRMFWATVLEATYDMTRPFSLKSTSGLETLFGKKYVWFSPTWLIIVFGFVKDDR